jgi:diguanylate cyclase (GGDEF)-like protein/PAS domain S-box-containing protein
VNRPPTSCNQRILVVDDTPSMHLDFQKILGGSPDTQEALASAEVALFGDVAVQRQCFELDSAFQGQEALTRVTSALEQKRPYAMAFIDMRMPPGWDGLETIERLWQVDPQLQVALCTAHSDYSWEQMAERLELGDRLLILKKPFDSIEIRQMACALTMKWQMTQNAAFKMSCLEQAVEERTRELSDANIIVQNSPTILYRLRGEPSFPLMYISHNITKFGHDAAELVASPNWAQALINPDDLAMVDTAMARVLNKDAEGASIEFRLRTGDGDHRWVENRYIPVRDKDGRLIEVEGIILDITERKVAEEKIALLARTDGLTGLANRATFLERLSQAFAASKRGAASFAIFYLDLDHFKQVNDTLGHPVGDLLLQEVSVRLSNCTRKDDVVARLGGDEFAILQMDMIEPANAAALAAKLQTTLALPYLLNDNDVRITASIGICPYVPGSTAADAMLAQADLALYRSKGEGRNQYHFHSEDLDQEVFDRVTLANDLRTAIEQNELELYYQPEVELLTGKILGMEALARWNHPEHGLLDADAFIPIAEKTGAIVALGHWVLEQACQQMHQWRNQGTAPPVITVNLSLAQIKSGNELVRDVSTTLARWGLQPSDLKFDVTEATLAQTKWTQNDVLPQLHELGVKIAIDNFGTEYSSFDYLKTYRVNHLKIAQSFLNAATDDADSATTVRAIINFARELGIGIIAEGVETQEQRALLISAGATTQAQGFYFSEALDSARASELLQFPTELGEQAPGSTSRPKAPPKVFP